MVSWTDRLGHKFPPYERIEEYAAKVRNAAEPSEAFEAAKVFLGVAMDLAEENVRLMYASGYVDAETLRMRDDRLRLCEALGCGVQR